MALPAGVLTAAVSFGNGFDVLGEVVPATLKIETFFGTPEAPGPERLVWAATGQAMLPIEANLTGTADEVVQLPAVDQPGWLDQYGNGFSNWYYRATLRYQKGNVSSQVIRDFQVIMGQATVDLDTLFQSGSGAPIVALRYPTRSVNGYLPDEDGNITIPLSGGGEGGADAREVQLRNSGTAIEWRYVGDTAWTLIVSLAALIGPKGNDSTVAGPPGTSVQLRTTATEIQWAPVGGSNWQTVATLASLKGADGAASTVAGPPGASAYAVWQAAGNSGSQADFLASLKGVKGDTVKGDPGNTGASAYDVWIAAGNTGTQAQFLAALKGDKGVQGTSGVSATYTVVPVGGTVTPAGAPVGLVVTLAD